MAPRTFPELEPGQEQYLRELKRAAFAKLPALAELERRLLAEGGLRACLFQRELHVDQLLERGRIFPGGGAQFRRGKPSTCHRNAARLFCSTEGAVRIASGYALSEDDVWRQHSWGVKAETGIVIETTERRTRYFGFIMDDVESMEFILGNPPYAKQERNFEFVVRHFGTAAVSAMLNRNFPALDMHREAKVNRQIQLSFAFAR